MYWPLPAPGSGVTAVESTTNSGSSGSELCFEAGWLFVGSRRPSGVGSDGQVPTLCLPVLSGYHSYMWVRFPVAFGVLGSTSPFA